MAKVLKPPYQDAKADQNEIELRCCHILIEPTCYSQLMEDLAFDQPETKLALPRFFMPEQQKNNGDNNAQPPLPPELSQEEVDQTQRRLGMTDARRNINPRMVKIFVDGLEQTHIDLTRQSQFQIALDAGASLIEVRGEDERGELLLATHIISYVNDGFDSAAATARLNSGNLKFEVAPIATLEQGPPRAMLALTFRPRVRWTRPWLIWREFANGGSRDHFLRADSG